VDRVFLDANVIFSAAYRPESRLRRLWGLDGVTLLTSGYAIEEARRNLDNEEQRDRLASLVSALSVLPTPPPPWPLPEGLKLAEKDHPILAAAICARASHLLTGDKAHFGPHYGQSLAGVRVLKPSEYLKSP